MCSARRTWTRLKIGSFLRTKSALSHIRERLSIPDDAIVEELKWLDELRLLRDISNGNLPEVEPSVNLGRKEHCHYRDEGRLLKSKIQRSFQRDGQKYQVRGLEVDKDGQLLVTDKRILLIHAGTTSIPIAKVLHVEVDSDKKPNNADERWRSEACVIDDTASCGSRGDHRTDVSGCRSRRGRRLAGSSTGYRRGTLTWGLSAGGGAWSW